MLIAESGRLARTICVSTGVLETLALATGVGLSDTTSMDALNAAPTPNKNNPAIDHFMTISFYLGPRIRRGLPLSMVLPWPCSRSPSIQQGPATNWYR